MNFLSAIIPTRNRAHFLGPLIDSLLSQRQPEHLREILIVDNNSTDATEGVVKKRMDLPSSQVRYVLEKNIGLHFARNRGVQEAKGTILAFLDDDMIVSSNWTRGCLPIVEGSADAVVGRILPKWEAKPPAWLHKITRNGVFGPLGLLDLGHRVQSISCQSIFGGNFFVPREIVVGLGGFNPDGFPPELIKFRGDGESGLGKKMERAGLQAVYSPVALVFHIISATRLTLSYLSQRYFNEGISQSYSSLREEKKLGKRNIHLFKNPFPGRRVRTPFLKKILAVLFWQIYRRGLTQQERMIEATVAEAYFAGFHFHQKLIAEDPMLREYVLKQDYWEPS
jgi:glycosyltransferase involved in cell wall biosynthesis